MKKATKVFLILAAAFLLLGIALCIISVAVGADPVTLLRDGTYSISISDPIGHLFDPDTYEEGREGSFGQRPGDFGEAPSGEDSYSVSSDIKNIEIEWVSGSVKIVRGEGNNITFSEYDSGGIDAEDRLYYTVDGDTLKIECCDSDKIQIGINFDGGCGDKELVVNVPYGIDILCVDTTSANMEIKGIEVAKRLYADSTSGFISIKGHDCPELEVHTTSGDIAVEGSGSKLDISTTSGTVQVSAADCGNVLMHSTSGKLSFDGSCREIYMDSNSGKVFFNGSCLEFGADTISGEVEAEIKSPAAEVDIETNSGAVSLTLPANIGFKLEFETVSGSLDSGLPLSVRGDEYVFNGGGTEVEVQTTSGDLSIQAGESA